MEVLKIGKIKFSLEIEDVETEGVVALRAKVNAFLAANPTAKLKCFLFLDEPVVEEVEEE